MALVDDLIWIVLMMLVLHTPCQTGQKFRDVVLAAAALWEGHLRPETPPEPRGRQPLSGYQAWVAL